MYGLPCVQHVVINSVSFLQVLVCRYLRQQQLHWILIQQEICQFSSQHLPLLHSVSCSPICLILPR